MQKMFDLFEGWLNGETPAPPVSALVGFNLSAVQPGHALVEFEASERHANPMGTLHGGILCDIADAAMSVAYASGLEEGETFTTVELKINFLTPVWNGKLLALGKVVQGGADHRPRGVRYYRRQGAAGCPRDGNLHDPARRSGQGPVAPVAIRHP